MQALFRHIEAERELRRRRRQAEVETRGGQGVEATAEWQPSGSAVGSKVSGVSRLSGIFARRWWWVGAVGVLVVGFVVVLAVWGVGVGRSSNRSEQTAAVKAGREGRKSPSGRQVPGDKGVVYVEWPEGERADARLEVDGRVEEIQRVVDPSSPGRLRLELRPGAHRLWFARRGFAPVEHQVAVAAGQQLTLRLIWVPVPGGVVEGERPAPPPS
ncbi:MAG: hypothetical protein RMJ16_15450, partial [Thermoguttaceae bacterium]|nr:hypothetical protein [Thermoguttaceae bacterium]